jgi:NAD+ synthase
LPETPLDLAKAKRKIVSFIKQKVLSARADGVVLGISGGIDSAVTAYLSVEALGSRRVFGLMMPDLRITPEEDVVDGKAVAEELCLESRLIDIAPIHKSFMKSLEPGRLAEGNLRARIRMSILYYHANLSNRLVVGTGDKSEASVGFFTKFGDGGVDMLPIGDLYKTEVRRMGEILGISRRIIAKRSSPRLWPGHTAEDELGAPYEAIDSVFRLLARRRQSPKAISSAVGVPVTEVKRILAMNAATAHKRMMPEICRVH